MPKTAKLYIALVVILAAVLAGSSVVGWNVRDIPRFLSCLVLTLTGSMLKVRLPGIGGTYSLGSIFLLTAIADLSLPELVTIACAAACVQCLWRPKKRPTTVQVLFSASSLALSATAARAIVVLLLEHSHLRNSVALFAVAGTVLYVINTGSLAIVLALVENKPIRTIWESWVWLSFPYYLAGALIAAGLPLSADWASGVLTIPLFVLLWLWYELYLRTKSQAPLSA